MKIRGARVLVTGASSGIGRAASLALAGKGARLAITSRGADRLTKVADEIIRVFPETPAPVVVQCDVADTEAVHTLMEDCLSQLGSIDVLINNAGIGVYGEIEKTSPEDFQSVMNVNFFGAVNCMLEVLPIMRDAGQGIIVNVASVAAIHGVPFLGAYCATKSALVSVSQSLRAELAGTGIRITLIYPGYTETDFYKAEKKVGTARRPQGPYASPDGVAEAIMRAVAREQKDVVLSMTGKSLALAERLAPWLVEKVMARLAAQLR